MRLVVRSLLEALPSIRRDGRRLLPMSLGIVWGMAVVMVLLSVAGGFERSQRQALAAYGDRFVLLRLNRAELDRAASGEEKRLMMEPADIERLRVGAPAIRHLSPMNMAYRAKITGRSGAGANVFIAGALPEITRLRHIPLAKGRFHDDVDEEQRSRVIVLGPLAKRQLFGRGQAVGQKVRVSGFSTSYVAAREQSTQEIVRSRRGASASASATGSTASTEDEASTLGRDSSIASELFTVIGVLKDVEVQKESYVSVARLAFVPFATSCAVFETDFNTIFIEPRTVDDKERAIRQFREVMGARYGFEPDDRNAVLVYFDSIERARSISIIFRGLRIFLAVVGVLILLVGAIGVMNVVLASIAARRFEIGLRKALGATPVAIAAQFFCEVVIVCVGSGSIGFGLGVLTVSWLSGLTLPQGFSTPILDEGAGLIGFGLLSFVAILAGVYPAWRASRMSPVDALRARS